jgi:peptidoglycan/LPS O-acetylase OafA/YrhL
MPLLVLAWQQVNFLPTAHNHLWFGYSLGGEFLDGIHLKFLMVTNKCVCLVLFCRIMLTQILSTEKMNKIYEIFKLEIDPNRIFGLDILRALAIMFVVIEHGSFSLPATLRSFNRYLYFDGVSIFFVLSGFLIGGILIKLIQRNGLNISILKDFWVRRWFRTLPNYFLILSILCILHSLFDKEFVLSSVYRFFIFSQNLFSTHPYFFNEAWSLSVEEWFYLILPILIITFFACNRSYKRSIFYVSIMVIILVISFRYYRFLTISINSNSEWDRIFRKQVSTRLDSLMFGVIGAYINYYYHKLWIKYKIQLLFLGILLFLVSKFILPNFIAINGIYRCVFSFTLISIATLFLLPYLSQLRSGKGIWYKPVTWISLISYSMYLLNYSIVYKWIINKIPWNEFIINRYLIVITKYGSYWVLVIGLSILIYKYFEIPMTSLREKVK